MQEATRDLHAGFKFFIDKTMCCMNDLNKGLFFYYFKRFHIGSSPSPFQQTLSRSFKINIFPKYYLIKVTNQICPSKSSNRRIGLGWRVEMGRCESKLEDATRNGKMRVEMG